MANRLIQIRIPEDVAGQIETLAEQSIEDVAKDLLEGFLNDGRRRLIRLSKVGISWPPDWYEMFLKVWGENKVAPNVRAVTRAFIMKDPQRGKWVPSQTPELRNRIENQVSRKPQLREDGNTFIAHTLMPTDWTEWIDEHYPKKRSTYIKLALFREISSWPWPRGKQPSVPKGLEKFQNDFM